MTTVKRRSVRIKDTGVYIITVKNIPGVHLPGTGGTDKV